MRYTYKLSGNNSVGEFDLTKIIAISDPYHTGYGWWQWQISILFQGGSRQILDFDIDEDDFFRPNGYQSGQSNLHRIKMKDGSYEDFDIQYGKPLKNEDFEQTAFYHKMQNDLSDLKSAWHNSISERMKNLNQLIANIIQ